MFRWATGTYPSCAIPVFLSDCKGLLPNKLMIWLVLDRRNRNPPASDCSSFFTMSWSCLKFEAVYVLPASSQGRCDSDTSPCSLFQELFVGLQR